MFSRVAWRTPSASSGLLAKQSSDGIVVFGFMRQSVDVDCVTRTDQVLNGPDGCHPLDQREPANLTCGKSHAEQIDLSFAGCCKITAFRNWIKLRHKFSLSRNAFTAGFLLPVSPVTMSR